MGRGAGWLPSVIGITITRTPRRRTGTKLAADYCQNYNPPYGNGLNGPSRRKIMEIVRFLFTVETLEDEPGAGRRGMSA